MFVKCNKNHFLANENSRRLGDEMDEWIKALNFLRRDRCCPRIESAKSSFHLLKEEFTDQRS